MRRDIGYVGLGSMLFLATACGEATSTPSSSPSARSVSHQEARNSEVTHIRQPDEPAHTAVATRETAPVAETAPATAPVLGTGPIRFERIAMASGVEDRQPVGVSTTFAAGANERLYVYLEGINTSGAAADLTVSFSREGGDGEVGGVRVNLPTTTERRAWRTWAFTRQTSRAGTWTAHVRNADGVEVGSTTFAITG